jgi:hypothetical protein
MNFITRQLEEFGQNPRTFPVEVLLSILRFIMSVVLALAPLTLFMGFIIKAAPFGPIVPGTKLTTPQLLLIFIPFFLLLWLAVLLQPGLGGNWFWLARRYRAPRNYKPETLFLWQSGAISTMNANNILKVGAAPEGLYLALFWPFAFLHPPLLIPWEKIVAARRKKWMGREMLILTVGEPKQATIMLQKSKSIELVAPYVAQVMKT